MKDYSKQKVKIEVYNTNATGDEIIPSANTDEDKSGNKQIKPKTSVNIGVPILLVAALAFAVYIVSRSMNKQLSERHRAARSGSYEPRYQQRQYSDSYAPRRSEQRPQRPRYPSDRYPSDRYPSDRYRNRPR